MKKTVLAVCMLAALVMLTQGAFAGHDASYKDPDYVGSETCKKCHKSR